MTNTFIKYITLIFLCCIITACGFHPRGDDSLPPKLRLLYVQSADPYGQFTVSLKKALQNVGVTLVDSAKDAPITLQVIQATLASRASSVGTSSQATVYIVTYNAQVALLDPNGNALVAPQDVSSTSTMIVNAQQVLNSTNQLDTLSQQLQRDVITQIFAFLSSHEAVQAAEKTPLKSKTARLM